MYKCDQENINLGVALVASAELDTTELERVPGTPSSKRGSGSTSSQAVQDTEMTPAGPDDPIEMMPAERPLCDKKESLFPPRGLGYLDKEASYISKAKEESLPQHLDA